MKNGESGTVTGFDLGAPWNQPNTSLSSISPYDVPAKIWGLIEESFSEFKVNVTESYPTTQVNGNTISWRIVRRNVGTGPNGRKQATKAQLTNWLGETPDGTLFAEYTQEHMLDFEFAVFSYSTAEADKLAWLLEVLIVLCEGPLRQIDPGFTLCFTQQTVDLNLQERHQDDLIARYIRFTCTVPVRYIRTEKALRFIHKDIVTGNLPQCEEFTRLSMDPKFYIPVTGNHTVTHIQAAYLITDRFQYLKAGVDYFVRTDSNNVKYVCWNDGKGATPPLNSVFKVLYTLGISNTTRVPMPKN